MKSYHRRQPPVMSSDERLKLMIALRRRKWTYKRIGTYVGMSANGVMHALRRASDPEAYYALLDEEVDNGGTDEKDW